MQLRSWTAYALLFALGCATSQSASKPAKKLSSTQVDAENEQDEEDSAPANATAASDDEAPVVPARPSRPKTADANSASATTDKAKPDEAAKPSDVPKRTAADPFGDVGFKEVDQKAWLAGLREKIAQQEKVPPAEVRVSPGLLRVAYVRSPTSAPVNVKPGRRAPLRRHEIVVVDNQGRRVASFRAVAAKQGDEPPKDLRFLSEERLVYEVVEPPPPEAAPAPKAARKTPPHAARSKKSKSAKPAAKMATPAAKPATPPPPTRLFVIQPIAPRARPIKCAGIHFTFSREHDKLAYVAGKPEAAFLAVDGAQIYPRRGRTVLTSAPAWSKDSRSLAFLESPVGKPTQLVLVAELDSATGDTTWGLPPTANTDGAQVFWADTGKLVVGKTQMRPIFSAAFTKEAPGR
jgi:hypothetical protein